MVAARGLATHHLSSMTFEQDKEATGMVEKIDLTPELAQQLMGNLYHRQRNASRVKVAEYARIMRDGGWKDYVPPAIMIDRKTGGLFNGLQRCAAVVASGVTIKVLIDRDADGDELFDVIDGGLKRDAAQFIEGNRKNIRASASRVILWYRNFFDISLSRVITGLQMHEVVKIADEFTKDFDVWANISERIYARTHLSPSVICAALTLAGRQFPDETLEFAEKMMDPSGLDANDPAWKLSERMNRVAHMGYRRKPLEDWTLFVRALNADITGSRLPSKIYTTISVWPRIGETERELSKRMAAVAHERMQRGKIEARIRRQVEAEMAKARLVKEQ